MNSRSKKTFFLETRIPLRISNIKKTMGSAKFQSEYIEKFEGEYNIFLPEKNGIILC